MFIKDLIKVLEKEYEDQKAYGEAWGEPEIHMDVFVESKDHPHLFEYAGVDKDIVFDWSGGGVFRILSGFRNDPD